MQLLVFFNVKFVDVHEIIAAFVFSDFFGLYSSVRYSGYRLWTYRYKKKSNIGPTMLYL